MGHETRRVVFFFKALDPNMPAPPTTSQHPAWPPPHLKPGIGVGSMASIDSALWRPHAASSASLLDSTPVEQ